MTRFNELMETRRLLTHGGSQSREKTRQNDKVDGIKLNLSVTQPSSATSGKCIQQQPMRSSAIKLRNGKFLLSCWLLLFANAFTNHFLAEADDSATAPAFDMGALASLASNLGSNPQIMSMVSSLLNQAQKPGPSAAQTNGMDSMGSMSEQDPNSIANGQENVSSSTATATTATSQSPPKAADPSTSTPSQRATATSAATTTTTTTTSTAKQQSPKQQSAGFVASPGSAAPTNSLGNLISSMLPNLGSLGGSLSGLLGLAGGGGSKSSAGGGGSGGGAAAASASSSAGTMDQSSASVVASSSTTNAAAPPTQQQSNAQSVINQVLSAYVQGQIPNELIQLGLSGRVPPQLIELALSGQVPPQMIQMLITGQVPMSTINAFLQTMQQQQQQQPTSNGGGGGNGPSATRSTSPGVFSATRSLFESMFNFVRNRDTSPSSASAQTGGNGETTSRPSITVPTWLGPIPLRMPSMPNVRSLGQMVGGTISNVASMIPF